MITAERTYTEDGKTYLFRDIEENGERKTQYLVKEKWGEEMWTDCDPDAESDVAGARPYNGEERKPSKTKPVDVAGVKADADAVDKKPAGKKVKPKED